MPAATAPDLDHLPQMISTRTGRPVVALADIDGVVYDFVHALARVAVTTTGRDERDFPHAECWDFFADQWGMTLGEFHTLYAHGVLEHDLCGTGTPLPGAVPGWSKLTHAGVAVVIATDCGAPGAIDEARNARRRWLDHWRFTHHDLRFTADKAAVAAELLDAGFDVYAIEDRPKNFDALCDVGARTYLAHQRWNRDSDDRGMRVRDFDEFAAIVVADLAGGTHDD